MSIGDAGSNDSIIDLFGQLVDAHLGKIRHDHPLLLHLTRNAICKKLRIKCFESLFTFLNKPEMKHYGSVSKGISPEIIGVLQKIYDLRIANRCAEADCLENLFQNFLVSARDEDFNVLKLLLCLADFGAVSSSAALFDSTGKMLNVWQGRQIELTGPAKQHQPAPTNTGTNGETGWFPCMHFFTEDIRDLGSEEFSSAMLHSLFTSPILYFHDQQTSNSLFGGLVKSRVFSPFPVLEIPDLSDDPQQRSPLPINPTAPCDSEISEDEGFAASEVSSIVSSTVLSNQEDIWEVALSSSSCDYVTWENIGCRPRISQQPYLSECGPQAVDELCWMLQCQEQLVRCAPKTSPCQRWLSSPQLQKDIINLLLGFPSFTFPFSSHGSVFSIDPSINISGISHDALQSVLQDFVTAGCSYYRLTDFCMPRDGVSSYRGGLVLQAFHCALRSILQAYRAAVLCVPGNASVFGMSVLCHRLLSQIRFLAELCHCNAKASSNPASQKIFPVGVSLITYLYKVTLDCINTDNYLLMMSLLRSACQPFVEYIQDWVYHGQFLDIFGEFVIKADLTFLETRTSEFWDKGYTLTIDDNTEDVLLFPTDLLRGIFRCGKALNLLKACAQDQILCFLNDSDVPRISLSFSRVDLHVFQMQIGMHVERAKNASQQLTLERLRRKQAEDRSHKEAFLLAQRAAESKAEQQKGMVDERNRLADDKKQIELKRLKDQMSADLLRRAEEKKSLMAEDRKFMMLLTEKEDSMTEKERELESRVRDEMVDYYTELSVEATQRKERALWRIRRGNLDVERRGVLGEEAESLRQEFNGQTELEDVSKKLDESVTLPSWAKEIAVVQPVSLALGGHSIPAAALAQCSPLPVIVDDAERPDGIGSAQPMVSVVDEIGQLPVVNSRTNIDVVSELHGDNIVSGEDEQSGGGGMEWRNFDPFSSLEDCASSQSVVGESGVGMKENRPEADADLTNSSGYRRMGVSHNVTRVRPQNGMTIAHPTDGHVTVSDVQDNDSLQNLEAFPQKSPDNVCKTTQTTQMQTGPQSNIFQSGLLDYGSPQTVRRNSGMMHPSKCDVVKESTKETNLAVVDLCFEQQVSTNVVSNHQLINEGGIHDGGIHNGGIHDGGIHNGGIHDCTLDNWREFTVKAKLGRRECSDSSATVSDGRRPCVRSVFGKHISKRTEYVEAEAMSRHRFIAQNVHGHSSDSTVQRILYYGSEVDKASSLPAMKRLIPLFSMDSLDLISEDIVKYEDNFDHLKQRPMIDVVSSALNPVHRENNLSNVDVELSEGEASVMTFTPINVFFQQTLAASFSAQIALVDKVLLDYFVTDLQVVDHIEAMRDYFFMANGNFAQNLTEILLEKLSHFHHPLTVLTPFSLSSVLSKALNLSASCSQRHGDRLSFSVQYQPSYFHRNAHDALDCLELRYKVQWPVNLVLTDVVQSAYSRVFLFNLQLKRVSWTLIDCWYRLKRDAIVKRAKDSHQFRQLQLHRQEMQHFVRVMQSYMANQIVQLSWSEFKVSLEHDVHSLDDLRRAHSLYIQNVTFRCLLKKKAAPIMKIIQNIFCLVLKFCSQLSYLSWEENPDTGEITHPNFVAMTKSYNSFKQHFLFLFNVVNKLAVRGYQPHLHELLLRLNFNHFYAD